MPPFAARTRCVFVLCLLAFGGASARAGDLNPPAGPVAPTPGPEPRIAINAVNTPGDAENVFRITQPGSYYLTGNVVGVAGRSGIEIASANVTLDLNGFAVIGVAGALGGVVADVSLDTSSIIVRNGTVSNWPGAGIELVNTGAGSLIEGVACHANGAFGMRCSGAGVIRGCIASNNSNVGIIGINGSVIENCNSFSNSGTGITVGSGSQVRGCVSRENTLGISTSSGATVIDCSVYLNTSNGIQSTGAGNTIERCSVTSNAGDGIQVVAQTRVSRCEIFDNGGDGIQAVNFCQITENNIGSHNTAAAAGIRLTSGDSMVSGNNITGNSNGIVASAVGQANIILRNTFSGNTTNAVLDASNRAAQFITPGANNFASTDPNANYTY